MFRKCIFAMMLTILVVALAACITTRDEPAATRTRAANHTD